MESLRSSRDLRRQNIAITHDPPHSTRRCNCSQSSELVSAGRDSHKIGASQGCHLATHKERSSRLITKNVSCRTTSAASTKASLQACIMFSVFPCLPHSMLRLISGILHHPRLPCHPGRLVTHHRRNVLCGHQSLTSSVTVTLRLCLSITLRFGVYCCVPAATCVEEADMMRQYPWVLETW